MKKTPDTGKKTGNGGIRETFESLLVALVYALLIRCFVIQSYWVPTPSMEKTLMVGDHLLAVKNPAIRAGLSRRDIVVFSFPAGDSDYVKRMIAMPGDVFETRNSTIYINGHAQKEKYIWNGGGFMRYVNYGPVRVPQDHVMMLGDNRNNSSDSRSWGPLPLRYAKAEAVALYWPVSRWRVLNGFAR